MGHFNKKKVVKQSQHPEGNTIKYGGNPDSYYQMRPSWCFNDCDKDKWPFTEENPGFDFWKDLLPKLKNLETQTWQEILVNAKKQNHSIDITKLNKCAQDRLVELHIEAESLISLRLQGQHRLYGFNNNSTFHIVWYDDDHGDNDTCVCKSTLKYT